MQENLQEQNIQFQEQTEQITKLWEVQKYYHQLSGSAWSTKLWLSSELSDQVAPAIVKLSSFTKKLKDKEVWYSDPFFAFDEWYRMCFKGACCWF